MLASNHQPSNLDNKYISTLFESLAGVKNVGTGVKSNWLPTLDIQGASSVRKSFSPKLNIDESPEDMVNLELSKDVVFSRVGSD